MSSFNAKELIKSIEAMQRQASNLISSTITPDIMKKLNPEQLIQLKKAKKDMKTLKKKGLTLDSEIFKNLK